MFLSHCGTWIYHVSIIDYLQKWNFDKKSEAFAKKWFLGKDAKGISAVPPEFYAKRYLRFMQRSVFVQTRNHDEDEEDRTYSLAKLSDFRLTRQL